MPGSLEDCAEGVRDATLESVGVCTTEVGGHSSAVKQDRAQHYQNTLKAFEMYD